MAGRQRRDAGGIQGLCELIDKHKEAVEFDLISLGLRLDDLGTQRLSWRDMLVITRRMPDGSALDRAINPLTWRWGLAEYLLAAIFDSSEVANWQRGDGRRHNAPKPTERPGVATPGQVIGEGAIPMDEMAEFLGWSKN